MMKHRISMILIACITICAIADEYVNYNYIFDVPPMQKIEGGTFYMSENNVSRRVTVSDFEMAIFEEGKNFSWFDAIRICNYLSRQAGYTPCYSIDGETDERKWQSHSGENLSKKNVKCNFNADGYRLPTEAEWEWAARGGNKSKGYTYSGSNNVDEVAWYSGNCDAEVLLTGEKKSNEIGLYDMSGNYFEWCWDCHYRYASYPQVNPIGYEEGIEFSEERILRGGAWDFTEKYCRISHRFSCEPQQICCSAVRLCRSLTNDYSNKIVIEQTEENLKALKPVMIEIPCKNSRLSSYEIAETEMNRELYSLLEQTELYQPEGNLPIEYLSWSDAVTLCNKLSMMYGYTPCYSLKGKTNPDKWGTSLDEWQNMKCNFNADGYRLPTEEEWLYAAKSGDLQDIKDYCQWTSEYSEGKSHAVLSSNANKLGLHNMCGNVQEWCWDSYDTQNIRKALRGGSYRKNLEESNLYARDSEELDVRRIAAGLRLCRSLDRTPQKRGFFAGIIDFFASLFGW